MEKPKPIRLLIFARMLKDLLEKGRIVFKVGEQDYYLETADFRFSNFVQSDQFGNRTGTYQDLIASIDKFNKENAN